MALAEFMSGAQRLVVSLTSPLPVGSGDPSLFTATIPNGAAVSQGVDLANHRLHHIVLPAGWSAAAVGFDVSHDGVSFAPLFNAAGEYSLSTASGGRAVMLDLPTFIGVRFVRIRSGVLATPVNQAAARDIALVTVPR